MPEFRLSESPQQSTTLDKIPEFEVWEDEQGDAVWRDDDGQVLCVNGDDGRVFCYSTGTPSGTVVVRKLSDTIVIRW